MGQRGPLPKPTKLREREGNPRRRPLPKNEPQPPAITDDLPKPPEHLSEEAAKVFTALCRLLRDSELLTTADLMPIEMLADSYTQWIRTIKLRAESGVVIEIFNDEGTMVNSYESPQSKLCRSLAADCNRWFKVLGLGPAYRVGLRTDTDGGEEIDDPIAASIANG